MKLKFWKRGPVTPQPKKDRRMRPRELSDAVGIHMITKLKEDPDWVWSLRAVERPRQENPGLLDLRIFDPQGARSKEIVIEGYASLDEHPDLILYYGTEDKVRNAVQLIRPAHAA